MDLAKIIESLDPVDQDAFLEVAQEYLSSLTRETAQNDFITFAHEMWPGFIDENDTMSHMETPPLMNSVEKG